MSPLHHEQKKDVGPCDKVHDDDLREQMKDIWVKLMKSTGLQLVNPPILFGVAENQIQWDLDVNDNISRM